MAPRFPINEVPDPASKDTLETRMKAFHHGLVPTVSEDGSELTGWCAPFSYAPQDMVLATMDLAKASFQPHHVKPRNRELAVMAFISVTQVPYMRNAHSFLGEHNEGGRITSEQIQDALAGKVPQGLNEEEQAAYRLGKVLASLKSPLDDESWKEFSSKLSKSEIVGITNFVGIFQWLALLIQLKG